MKNLRVKSKEHAAFSGKLELLNNAFSKDSVLKNAHLLDTAHNGKGLAIFELNCKTLPNTSLYLVDKLCNAINCFYSLGATNLNKFKICIQEK